jgi:hypothetical protein
MNSIVEMILGQLGSQGLESLGTKIGLDENTTHSIVSTAIPLLTSALARNASSAQGAQALHGAIEKDHDGSILDDVMGFLGNPQSGNGAGILGHVLGNQRGTVEAGLAQGTGADSGKVGSVLETLVMGALGKTTKEQGLDAQGLSRFLGAQQQQAQSSAPDIMGMLGGLLDSDKDGNVVDDIGGMLGKLFGGKK